MSARATTLILLASSLGLSACYPTAFTPSGTAPAWYHATERDPNSVKVLTLKPDSGLYAEVGLISAAGAGAEDALKRAKDEAAAQGCDAIFFLGESVESGPGTPGAEYGMTRNHVRASCLVERPASERTASLAADKPACAPACRESFVCVNGACVSACNPPCAGAEHCVVANAAATCVTTP